jgi:hypothetical protein
MIRISRRALAIDLEPFAAQHRRHPPRAEERPSHEQRIDPPHQRQIAVVVGRPLRPVNPGARQRRQHAPPADREIPAITVEHRSPVRRAHPRVKRGPGPPR